MPFVAIWLDLKIVILSDVRARQICDIAYMWNLNNGTNELTYKIDRITDVENKFTVTKG